MDDRRTVRDGYDAVAPTYATRRDLDGRDRELSEAFGDDLPDGSRVLDAGVGSGGPATVAVDGAHDIVGLDLSRGQLELLADHLPGVGRCQGDLAALPFADDSFDALVSSHAVIHVPRDQHAAVFAEFERVLAPGGEAFLVLGEGAWEGRNPDWLGAGAEMVWSFYGRERNLELLREAGFEIRDWTVVGDELGDGEWCAVRARVEG